MIGYINRKHGRNRKKVAQVITSDSAKQMFLMRRQRNWNYIEKF
jgi:hypothetical protein